MAESDEFEFSLDLADCLKDNLPMLCPEIPQDLWWIYDRKGHTYFELNTFTMFWALLVFLRVFANDSNIDRKNFGTSTISMR